MADFFSRFRRDRGDASGVDAWLQRGEDENAIWSTLVPGPHLDEVSTRLSTMPGTFFDEAADLNAIAGDLQLELVDGTVAGILHTVIKTGPSRRGAALALWLWASEEVVAPFSPRLGGAYAGRAIAALALRLAPIVDPAEWLVDAQRREEASRLFLLWSGVLPAGEDATTARALWERIDSLTKNAALQSALADHQHRLDVLAQLQSRAAAEAAARYNHE
jgi:hypothetical protein